jgi:lactate dehydrogenase-like 2-hydroxyacid dehydrogenase
MSRPKVIVTRRWHPDVEAVLTERYDTQLNEDDHPMSVAELQDALRNADAVLPTVSDKIDAEVLSADNIRARILGSNGVGFNHIDLEAAKAAGLTVTNTPEVLTDCTADLAMTLLLAVARRAGEGERHLRNGEWTGWRPTHMMGTSVTGKTLGLIGMGRIARAVAARAAHGFNMKIIFHDPFPPKAEDIADLNATPCASPEEVFAQADFVSLHCPGGKETYHLISAGAFAAMKPSAFLINTARGDVIDEAALVTALQNGDIAGAGLDVFEKEPTVSPALLEMENVVLLPHLGSATLETRAAMGMRVVENIDAFFADDTPRDKLV